MIWGHETREVRKAVVSVCIDLEQRRKIPARYTDLRVISVEVN